MLKNLEPINTLSIAIETMQNCDVIGGKRDAQLQPSTATQLADLVPSWQSTSHTFVSKTTLGSTAYCVCAVPATLHPTPPNRVDLFSPIFSLYQCHKH